MKTMPDKTFYTLICEASTSTDRDAFTSTWATSSIWGDDPRGLVELARLCGRVWDVAHLDISRICETAGIQQRTMAMQIGTSVRTVENWSSRGARLHIIVMLARIYGLMDDLQ